MIVRLEMHLDVPDDLRDGELDMLIEMSKKVIANHVYLRAGPMPGRSRLVAPRPVVGASSAEPVDG